MKNKKNINCCQILKFRNRNVTEMLLNGPYGLNFLSYLIPSDGDRCKVFMLNMAIVCSQRQKKVKRLGEITCLEKIRKLGVPKRDMVFLLSQGKYNIAQTGQTSVYSLMTVAKNGSEQNYRREVASYSEG